MSDSLQQNQIIAIEKGVKDAAKTALTAAYKTVQKPELFAGQVRTFEPINDDAPELPDESVKVQITVNDLIKQVTKEMASYLDTVATKDIGNTIAKADLVVDGTILAQQVPVTYLLFLEKELTDLSTFIGKMPVLDASYDWRKDENSNLFKSDPVRTQRTAKIQRPIVLYDATEEHPAQTQLITEDVTIGHWQTVKLSGALPIPEKERLQDRVQTLLRAVKSAREKGNSTLITKQEVGGEILRYLFN